MSFKKTVTFTANVSDYTDGTVSARVQAENNILGQLVTWLLAQNTSISQIEKVEIGDSRWSGYPMYAVQSNAPTLVTQVADGYGLLSDIYMLGKDKNNFLLGMCVDNHKLLMAPTCSFEFQDYLNTYSSKDLSIILEQLRNLNSSRASNRISFGGAVKLCTFNTTADELSITLNYWKGTDSLVFYVSGELYRVFFSFDAVDSSFGWVSSETGTSKKLTNYSFNETIQADETTQTLTSESSGSVSNCLAKGYATNLQPYFWSKMDTNNSYGYYSNSYVPVPIKMHRMNSVNNSYSTNITEDCLDYLMNSDTSRVICGSTLVNFPRITVGQLYLRKLYIPNRQTISPVKLGYTPGNLTDGSVYEVNNKYYLCLKNGWCSYFVEVADQG